MGNRGHLAPMHHASSMERARSARLVVLHAVEDEEHLRKLCSHLDRLERSGLIQTWHPGLLTVGDNVPRRVREEVERADGVLLLVSAELLGNEDFLENQDLLVSAGARAPEESAGETESPAPGGRTRLVVPICVRDCGLDHTVFQNRQALPRDGTPVAQAVHADQVWTQIVREIQQMLSERRGWSVHDLEVYDPRRRERIAQVVRIAQLRFPDAAVTELPAAEPFAGLVVVTQRTEQAEDVEPIGVLDGPMTEAALAVFQDQVEKPYRDREPLIRTRVVHVGEAVAANLYRRARRAGVEIETFASYQKIVDFQRYLGWQTEHVDKDPAYPENLYVDQRAEVRIRLDREETGDVLSKLVELLEDPYPRVVLVLGDFGTGKTFLLRQLVRRLARRYVERPAEVPPPVLVEMRDLEKSVGLDGLLAQHFQLPGGREISVAAFRYLLSEGRAALLFDGFDELAFRVTYDSVLAHLQTVLAAAEGKAKVVVTSRTAHFLNDQGVELTLARKVAEREGYRLIKLHAFDEAQIHAALAKQLGGVAAADRRMALLREVEDLMGLSENPRMLGFILEIPTADLEEAREKKGQITSATLYELLVTKWLEGEAARSKPRGVEPVLTLAEMWQVVTDLAVIAWTHTEKRIRKEDIPAALWAKLERMDPSRKVEVGPAEHTMGSRSLLVRDEQGRFSFWHESILDWLVARVSAGEVREKKGEASALGQRGMSDLMSDFFAAMAGRENAAAWARAALSRGSDVAIQNANRVLRRMGVEVEAEVVVDKTLDLSGHDLRGQDLSGSTHLRGGILEQANLSGATLIGADLSGVDLSRANLAWANAEKANLEGACLEQADLLGARLLGADLRGARLSGSRLRYARLVGAQVDADALRVLGEARVASNEPDLWGLSPPQPVRAEPVALGARTRGPLTTPGLAISPDGALLALGDAGGAIVLWDLGSRRALHGWAGSRGPITSLAFSPDGRILASASSDETVRLWDPVSHAPIAALQGHSASVRSVAFSPDGRTLASASADKTIRLWDAVSHDSIATLQGHSAWVRSVAFSLDGRTLASASADKTVHLWDTVSHAPIAILRGHSDWVRSVAFSPDGRTLASASADTKVRLWDAVSHASMAILEGHSDWVCSVAFSPDGRTLASASADKTVRLWDAVSHASMATLEGHSAWVRSVAFSPDGRTLASASDDKTVRLWDPVSHAPIAPLQGHSNWGQSVAFSPDGRTLASASFDRTVRLWDAVSHVRIAPLQGHSDSVRSVAFSSDGRTLASASDDKTVRLWDPISHAPIATLQAHSISVQTVAFSPDGRTLASASSDKAVRLWDAVSRGLIATFQGHSNWVRSIAFSPDGGTLASASADNTIRLWDAVSRGLIATLQGHSSAVQSVAFSPDGRTLASASADNTVRLWDAVSRGLIATLQGHSNWVQSVAFSPDGGTLASASDDGTIRLWDIATVRCLVVFVPAAQGWAAYSPDGRYKVHGDIGGRFWHVVGLCRFEPGELDDYVDAFTEHKPRRLRLDEPFY